MTAPEVQAAPPADPKAVGPFLIEFNILRRHVLAYPAEHPVPRTAAAKVAAAADRAVGAAPALTIGFSRDVVLLGDHPLDRSNPVYRDLARVLSHLGIATVTVEPHVAGQEFLDFAMIAARRPQEVRNAGGISRVMEDAGIRHITVTEIDYSLFVVREQDHIVPDLPGDLSGRSLHEQFVHGLLDGTLDPFGTSTAKHQEIDPEVLAQILNGTVGLTDPERERSYEAIITSFINAATSDDPDEQARFQYTERLRTLVDRLNPEMRNQFVGDALVSLAETPAAVKDVISLVPRRAILDALAELNHRQASLPPLIMNLCKRFAPAAPAPVDAAETAQVSSRAIATMMTPDADDYVPDSYRQALQQATDAPELQQVLPEAAELRKQLAAENPEAKVAAIVLEILRGEPGGFDSDALVGSLAELCMYHLEGGDFAALADIFRPLQQHAAGEDTIRDRLASIIGNPSFARMLAAAPGVWGKERYEEIRGIIILAGAAVVPALLDRLAEEDNMSLRRYYLSCLVQIGSPARDAAVQRLGDGRWFFVRNLVALLRTLNDAEAVRPLRRMLHHDHPKVRQEALQTLVHFGDPEGDKILLRQLDDRDNALAAVQLVGSRSSAAVHAKLVSMLENLGLTGGELDVRCAAAKALAEAGNPDDLPLLGKLLQQKSLLRGKALLRLKLEIVKNLPRYRHPEAVELIQAASQSDIAELQQAARAALRLCGGKQA